MLGLNYNYHQPVYNDFKYLFTKKVYDDYSLSVVLNITLFWTIYDGLSGIIITTGV